MNVRDATFSFVPRTPAARVACFLALLVLATAAAVAAETAIPLSQANSAANALRASRPDATS